MQIDIDSGILTEVLAAATATGADYGEVFIEHSGTKTIQLMDGNVYAICDKDVVGASVRIFKGLRSVFASTADTSREGLLACANRVAAAMGEGNAPMEIRLKERIFTNIHPIRIVPSDVSNKEKIDVLKEASAEAKAYHTSIAHTGATMLDKDRRFVLATTEGLLTSDRQIRTRLMISAVASRDGENQTGYEGPGLCKGFEHILETDTKAVAREAARQAVTMLDAGYCNAGVMPVAIGNGFGGVIFHEACGHSLEAAAVAYGQSEFCGKLGQQVADSKVTAIDDGTIVNAWGSINIDDEGTPAKRNVLIENGILKSYMIDKFNGRRMGMESTGSSRRESYEYAPVSRMTNTFIAPGCDSEEDIIASMELGLYAARMGGGSVNPMTGEFNFGVAEAYMVRNGKICEPVRGASLVGKGSEVIGKIDMVGSNVARATGICGASSGSVPTEVGQPMIRVSSITVGGR